MVEVTVADDNAGSNRLGHQGNPVEQFDEEFKEYDVEEDIGQDHQEIPEELYPSRNIRIEPDHIFGKQESCRERDAEGKHVRRGMGFESEKTQVKRLFAEHQMITHIKRENIQEYIDDSAGGIAVELQGHDATEQRIEQIDK